MKENKLIYLLRTFSAEEMKRFEKFTMSPYHRQGKNCAPLLGELKKFHPGYDAGCISYEALYSAIYPGKKYNKQVMWNLVSALESSALRFLEYEAFGKSEFQKRELLASELISRNLARQAQKTLHGFDEFFQSEKIGFEYLKQRIVQRDAWINFYQAENKHHLMAGIQGENMEYRILDFLKTLKASLEDQQFFSEMYNVKSDTNIAFEFAKNLDLSAVADYCRKRKFKYHFYISILYRSIMMILKPHEDVHFLELRRLFEKHHNRFDRREKRNMIIPMVNYCVMRRNVTSPDYRRIAFELNDFRLREGLAFYPENRIPKQLYTQMLVNALTLKEIKWAESFIKDYSDKLHPGIMNSMRSLAQAYLEFEKRKFGEALVLLNNVEFADVRDKLHVRLLTAKTYYELGETETLLSYIDSSKHFLLNSASINESRKRSYNNFFIYLSKLASTGNEPFIRSGKSRKKFSSAISEMKNYLDKEEQIESKIWLQRKTEEKANKAQ